MRKMIHAETNSLATARPLTMEDIKKVAIMTYYKPELPIAKDYKKSLFEKLMNKFGWYKQYEVIIVDICQFKFESFMKVGKERRIYEENK